MTMKPDEMQLYIMKLEKRIAQLEHDNKRWAIDTHNVLVRLKKVDGSEKRITVLEKKIGTIPKTS